MRKADADLKLLGGTFVTPSFGHSGAHLASYTYVPEAKEEDERVNTAGKYILPERWLIPCNDPHSNLKAKYFHKRGSGFIPPTEIPEGLMDTIPFEYECDDVAQDIAELLDLAPSMVLTIYHRTMEKRPDDDEYIMDPDKRDLILKSMVEAMTLVREDTKNIVRSRLKHFPNSRPVRNMLKALG